MKIKLGNILIEDATTEDVVELVNKLGGKKTPSNTIITGKSQEPKKIVRTKGTRPWTKSEDDILFRHIGKSTCTHICKLLPNRTHKAVIFRVNALKKFKKTVSPFALDRYKQYLGIGANGNGNNNMSQSMNQ